MLTFEQLDKAARMIAQTAPLDDRDDVYQDAWIKFLRWPPRHITMAFRQAKQARDTLWQRNQRRRHADIDDIPDYGSVAEVKHWLGKDDPIADQAIALAILATVPGEIVRLAIVSERGPEPVGMCVRDRVRLHRWRKVQVQEGEKT